MILERILATKRREVAALRQPRRSLAKALARPGLAVVAEIKRASPSKGVIRYDLEPEALLAAYEAGGADAVSVLTDREYFSGDGEVLRALRARTELPLLRKDFLVDPLQLYESRFLGADAVLLIAAALEDPRELQHMLSLAAELGMEALVEVHTPEELLRVLDTDAAILGINNRDLRTFSVDLSVTERLLDLLRAREPGTKRLVVAESGVRSPEDARFLRRCGADAVLVGEALVRAAEPEWLLREFAEAGTP